MAIGGIGIIILVGISQMKIIYGFNFNLSEDIFKILFLPLPLFVFSGLIFTLKKLLEKRAWVKIIIVLFLGIIALYLVSLPLLWG